MTAYTMRDTGLIISTRYSKAVCLMAGLQLPQMII